MPNLSLLRWLLQRITAILLIFFLGYHIIFLHFFRNEGINFTNVKDRIQGSYFWLIFYGLFLISAVFHALNGVYEIIADYAPRPSTKLIIGIMLWLIGLTALILGFITLLMFWK